MSRPQHRPGQFGPDNPVTKVELPTVLDRGMQHRPDVVLDLDTSGSLASSARRMLPDDRSVAVCAPFQEERFPW
ncbi:hypothetical protein [Streptomyces sp. NPDC048438]|uniref:hypothetical protein n=1 Tax=Streptomyces sp. NPDC048438 TaxID=3365551 RepID=UPI00371C343F